MYADVGVGVRVRLSRSLLLFLFRTGIQRPQSLTGSQWLLVASVPLPVYHTVVFGGRFTAGVARYAGYGLRPSAYGNRS